MYSKGKRNKRLKKQGAYGKFQRKAPCFCFIFSSLCNSKATICKLWLNEIRQEKRLLNYISYSVEDIFRAVGEVVNIVFFGYAA